MVTHARNNQRNRSKFQPQVSTLSNSSNDILRLLTIGIMVLVVLLPLLSGIQVSNDSSEQILIQEDVMTSAGRPDNLLYIGLPDTYAVTPGETMGMKGFAYVNTAEERIYFVDPIGETTIDMALPSSYSIYSSLLAVDVDDNGDIEFVGIRRVTTTTAAVYIVDFDSDTYDEHTFSSVGAVFYGTGDFNGDTQLDVALFVNNNYLQIMDLASGSILGTFIADTSLRAYNAIGDFTASSGDEIIVTNQTEIYLIEGDGTQVLNTSVAGYVKGIELFNFGGGFADIVVFDSLGDATARQGSDLSTIFTTKVGPIGQALYGITGNFTADTQEDIYIQSNGWASGLLLNGTNGNIIRETNGTMGYSTRLDTGNIDGEPTPDIVTETDLDNPCFIHGATGEIAYTESLIVNPSQIFTFDVDSNSRDDVFIRSGSDLYILLSELNPPMIYEEPIDPIHPTVVDDIVTFEIFVDEGSTIESADLFVRKFGQTEWTKPHNQLFSPDGETYFAFFVGLEAGQYEYYYEMVDIYLNIGFCGNMTHPKSFNITGHLAWEYDKTGYFGDCQSMAYGNDTDGGAIIYTLEL
ncbi:MAG: hypothetical protein ACFFEV_10910, partial [Candidatus Thorarchaeota archaeon]